MSERELADIQFIIFFRKLFVEIYTKILSLQIREILSKKLNFTFQNDHLCYESLKIHFIGLMENFKHIFLKFYLILYKIIKSLFKNLCINNFISFPH